MKSNNRARAPLPPASPFMVISAMLMLLANVFIFVPFSIYLGNIDEFEAGFLQILGGYPEFIALAGLALLLPPLIFRRHSRYYATMLFVLALFTWLQSTLLMWDYGVLDGRGMTFEPFHFFGILDLIILAALALAAFFFAARIAPIIIPASWFFILSQLILMLTTATGRTDIWIRNLPQLEIPETVGALSSQQNIFHFILDSAQSDVFLELVDEAGLRNQFKGFTLFLENAAVAPHTAFGVPSTFSGRLFDGTVSPEEYFDTAVKTGFHSKLFEAGYSINLVPLLGMSEGPNTSYFEIPPGYRGSSEDLIYLNITKLMDSALFRIAPHFLRMGVYNGGNWLLSRTDDPDNGVRSFREKTFFKDYIDKLQVGQEAPAYHFVHLMPPHPPYVTLADGTYAGKVLPGNRENYTNEMRPLVRLLSLLFDKLKALGVYDSAAIVIQGDHGSGVPVYFDGELVEPCLHRLPALLAVKPPTAEGEFTVSSAPTSILDIAPTMLNFIGLNTHDIFKLEASESRIRPFFVYEDNRITNYQIQGSVYDPHSCSKAGSLDIEINRADYVMGTRIDFGMQGNASTITDYGWGPQLKGHSWSKAKKAALVIQVPEQHRDTDLALTLWYNAFINAEKLPRQRIEISVNGAVVDAWVENTGGLTNRRISIPASANATGKLDIVFSFPDAASPASLGIGSDRKALGIALRSVQLDTLH